MAELITEEQPRIKYQTHRIEHFCLQNETQQLTELSLLMKRFEELGATPILNDGLVAGNCGVLLSYAQAGNNTPDSSSDSGAVVLVSRSGKPPGHLMTKEDFVRIDTFDRSGWKVSGHVS